MKDSIELSKDIFKHYKEDPFDVNYDLLDNFSHTDHELRTPLEAISKSQKIMDKFIKDILNSEHKNVLVRDLVSGEVDLKPFFDSFNNFDEFYNEYKQYEGIKAQYSSYEAAIKNLEEAEATLKSLQADLNKNNKELGGIDKALKASSFLIAENISLDLLNLSSDDLEAILVKISQNKPQNYIEKIKQKVKNKPASTEEEEKINKYKDLLDKLDIKDLDNLKVVLKLQDRQKQLNTENVRVRREIGRFEHITIPSLKQELSDLREKLPKGDIKLILYSIVGDFLERDDNPNQFTPKKRLEQYYQHKKTLSEAVSKYKTVYKAYEQKFKSEKEEELSRSSSSDYITSSSSSADRSSSASSEASAPSSEDNNTARSERADTVTNKTLTQSVKKSREAIKHESSPSQTDILTIDDIEFVEHPSVVTNKTLKQLQDDVVKEYKAKRKFGFGSSLIVSFDKLEKEVLNIDQSKRDNTKNIESKKAIYIKYLEKAKDKGAMDHLSEDQKIMAASLLSVSEEHKATVNKGPDATPVNQHRLSKTPQR